MNLALICILFLGGVGLSVMSSTPSALTRRLALAILAVAWGVSFFCGVSGWQFHAFVFNETMPKHEAVCLIVLCGTFFLSMLARGKASHKELAGLLFLAAGTAGCLLTLRMSLFFLMLLLFVVITGIMLQFNKARVPPFHRRYFYAGAFLCLGLGVLSAVFTCEPVRALSPGVDVAQRTLFTLFLVCLMGAFPMHFWVPGLLAASPFNLMVVVPVVLPRIAAVIFLRVLDPLPDGGMTAGLLSVLGFSGALWCALAGLASRNLGERFGYWTCAHASIALWGIGQGCVEEAFFFLLVTTPAVVLAGIVSGVLMSRAKVMDLEILQGVGYRLRRFKLFLGLAVLGMSLFPGFVCFSGLAFLLKGSVSGAGFYGIAVAVLLLFLGGCDTFVRLCFPRDQRSIRNVSDLNSREMTAAVPLVICLLSGLWPYWGKFFLALFSG